MKNDKIYKICEQKLYYLNYSKRTISIYLHYIKEFLSSIELNIQRVNSGDFQNYLDGYKFTSVSQQNQIINSVRFLYKYGLNKKYDKVSFKRPKKEKKLPKVIDGDLPEKKLYAEWVKKQDKHLQPILFRMYDRKDYTNYIWKLLKPEYKLL